VTCSVPKVDQRTQDFQRLRPLLFAIAYRLLSSVSEAEDAVQETWLRYAGLAAEPDSAEAYLSTVVTRICIDVLRSARMRREAYVGPWFPEPLLDDPYQDPQRSAELADSVSMAALLLLERLSPLERAVYVLREVFAYGFGDIAAAVGRSEQACRQLAVRARRHMNVGRPRFTADRASRARLAGQFFAALHTGDVDGLRALLATDVRLAGDGGGKAPQWSRPISGADDVSRVLVAMTSAFARLGGTVTEHHVNGQPGSVFRVRDGRVLNAWSLEIADGRIQMIRSILNPVKLAHLGPVADAWAIHRSAARPGHP
jgi:RNA polymerase sigma-70 factor (ECF subfamily)